MEGRTMRAWRGLAALSTLACMLAFAMPALANAPNPETTKVDQVVVNSDGSRTVTVEGTWTWQTQTKCGTSRNGVGYQIDWFDNTANPVGTANDPSGILFAGDAVDNIVHSVETLGGSSVIGQAFYDGVPSSYLTHNTTSPLPNSTDAKNWFSQCDGLNASGVTAGTWGPITHTYAASFTGPIKLCPIMYDPHGGHDNSGQSSVKDITAGGSGRNTDNSYETNQFTGGPGSCPQISIPTITTTASSAAAGSPIHDTATLTGSSGAGTITFNLYAAGSGCSGAPLFTSSVSTTGDGPYTSGDTTQPAGSYQWQASFSSSSISGIMSNCSDPNEVSTVGKAGPTLTTNAVAGTVGQPIHDVAHLSGGSNPTGTITWNVYASSDTTCTTPLNQQPSALTATVNGDNDYTSPNFTPSAAGSYQWVATYSGDSNNSTQKTACGDPNEVSTVTNSAAPAITLHKVERIGSSGPFTHGPVTGNVGDTVNYRIMVTNTGNTKLVLQFTDAQCDAGTLSAPSVISGNYDAATNTLSAGGELQYTCSHVLAAGDQPYTNTASVIGTPPSGPPVSATDSVQAFAKQPGQPGIKVLKLQRVGSSGRFTHGLLTVTEHAGHFVVFTIDYEIRVTNTGSTPLTLSLNDRHCDAGTIQGPSVISGTLNGDVLSAGGKAQYTCSHRYVQGDPARFTNVAVVTGTPPNGPPVHGRSHVTVHRKTVSPKTKLCRTPTGRVIHYKGNRKPAACKFHPKPPKHPRGFTG
jgi:hypothetical protein